MPRRRRCGGCCRPWRSPSRCAALKRIAGTLVEVYLGQDAGQRVLDGKISRGVADRISAVLWFSDLRGYTKITDTAPPREIIPLLNDYADARHFGHPRGRRRRAQADRRRHARHFQGRRSGRGLPLGAAGRGEPAAAPGRSSMRAAWPRTAPSPPSISASISARFSTAISAARTGSTSPSSVPPSTRRAASPRCAARSTAISLLSADFVAATPEPERSWLVSVGRYALRGVGRSQELFTLDPERL